MIYFPVTLSVVLGSSLFVAIFFNSVLVSQFMTTEDRDMPLQNIIKLTVIVGGIGLLIAIFGGSYRGLGTLMIVVAIMLWIYRLFLRRWANGFQNKVLPRWERFYERIIRQYHCSFTTPLFVLSSFKSTLLSYSSFNLRESDRKHYYSKITNPWYFRQCKIHCFTI